MRSGTSSVKEKRRPKSAVKRMKKPWREGRVKER
jgi:hypothetical protein|tara:strand:- start:248 stop:349 length:102 start_codon:yes stop_codon:yes gene_type:complete